MSVLRVAAVLLGLGAVPVLFVSAETLSSRVRDAADHSVGPENIGRALRTAQAAEPRRQSETPAKADGWRHASLRDGSIAPTFGRVVIDPASASRFEGQSAPGAEVTLSIDGRPLGAARADETGVWRFDLTTPLAAGDHIISLSTTSRDRKGGHPGQDIRIAIPGVLATGALVAYQAPGSDGPVSAPAAEPPGTRESVRKRAEELAAAAAGKRLRCPSDVRKIRDARA